MRRLLMLLMLLSLGLATVLPADPVQSRADVQTCTMNCCHQEEGKGRAERAMACQCASPCVLPAQTGAVLPSLTRICPPSPQACCSDEISDEFAAARHSRPPVPPPRA